jgi:hypothetical protein
MKMNLIHSTYLFIDLIDFTGGAIQEPMMNVWSLNGLTPTEIFHGTMKKPT